MNPRVLVADDHPLLLRGLSDLLQATEDVDLIAATTSGPRALSIIRESQPEIAILDVMMPDVGGMDILRTIHERALPVRVIFLTATMRGPQVAEAIELGVWGILLKDYAADSLVDCLRQVAAGRKWLPAELVARATQSCESDPAAALARLTSREREISELVCRGLSNRSIATAVGSSEGTVSIHLHNVYRKLGIGSRTTLATMFVRHQVRQE